MFRISKPLFKDASDKLDSINPVTEIQTSRHPDESPLKKLDSKVVEAKLKTLL